MGISNTATMAGPRFGLTRDKTQERPRRVIKTGDLAIDLGGQRVHWKGQPVEVTATELRLLELVAPLVGSPLPSDFHLGDAWGPDYERDFDLIKRSLWSLQAKTEDYLALRRLLWALRRQMNYKYLWQHIL